MAGLALVLTNSRQKLAAPLLVIGYTLALAVQQVHWPIVGPLVVLLVAAVAVSPKQPVPIKAVGCVLFLVIAELLRLHLLPGFSNPVVFDHQVSSAAPRYKAYLNLDKLLVMVWIVYAWRRVRHAEGIGKAARNGLGLGALSATICLFAAWTLELVYWDPKLPADSGIWLLNMTLLVAFGEELFFRGFIQEGLTRALRRVRHGELVAIAVGAALSGLVHYNAGVAYTLICVLAGVAYGVAYRRGGIAAAVMAHVLLNAAQAEQR